MNKSIYRKLAITNIKNNRRTYVPYLLTCVVTVMMFYIIYALTLNKGLEGVPGETSFRMMLDIGVGVVAIFSVIFLFYTNSFLIKQRKKEIGIYNVLGLGKRHIAKMLGFEMLLTVLISFAGGFAGGILFGKLVFLILLRILHFDVGMVFAIEPAAIVGTIALFGCIFGACLLYNLFQIKLSNPVELLRGGNVGEREPKTKLLITVIGVLTLGGGYYIALSAEKPMEVLGLFFVAVILVIIGTYALFTAGSIAVLKLMRKNKRYYYQAKHFTSVSGMMYRMKQNAAGLANICILSTMVLVMISSTVAMYVGMEDILRERFPQECMVEASEPTEEKITFVKQSLHDILKKHHVTAKNEVSYSYTGMAIVKNGNQLSSKEEGVTAASDYGFVYFLTVDEYNKIEGKNISLAKNQVLTYGTKEKLKDKTIVLNGMTYDNKEVSLEEADQDTQSVYPGYYIVMKNQEEIDKVIGEDREYVTTAYYQAVDLKGAKADKNAVYKEIQDTLSLDDRSIQPEIRELSRDDFYSLYGAFFFLGIFFGILFLMATVLIIYYKQISEGYSDKERFEIMRKVGMSQREVKRAIRSQVLSVFFLPLIVAVIHIAVAFTVITKLLGMLNLTNVPLIFLSTVITVIVFAIFYGIVFGITTKEYYKIVK